jgi:hypothetical protein
LRLAAGGIDMQIYIWKFISLLCRSLIQIKVLPAVLQKLVDSQISSGDRMQTLSRGSPLPETFQKAIHYPLANSKK